MRLKRYQLYPSTRPLKVREISSLQPNPTADPAARVQTRHPTSALASSLSPCPNGDVTKPRPARMAKRSTSPSASLSFSKAAIVDAPEMRAAMLDLLVLTFNCAKNLVEVPVLGEHLKGALRGEELPEIVVL